MYVTFRRYDVQPANIKEIIKLVNEGFLPIISSSFGFISYTVFSDEAGYICSVSVFTTRAGMEEANTLALDWAKENLASLLPHSPYVFEGESLLYKVHPHAF